VTPDLVRVSVGIEHIEDIIADFAAVRYHTPAEPLVLASGMRLAGATIAYQTWGSLNAARDNVIWVCHALTGSSDVESWWPGAFGPGRLLDPGRHFIVCANVLGSCYGSAGPLAIDPETGERWGGRFPEVTIGDMVEHQRRLADHLGIAGIGLVVGASMGGFQVLEWARREPARVARIAVVASSWRQPPQALALGRLQCEFIRRDPRFRGGDYSLHDAPEEGLALARQLGHISYRSPAELEQRFGRQRREDGHFQVLSYLDHQGAKLVRRFDAVSYLRLTEAMNAYDAAESAEPGEALSSISQPALVLSLDSDQLYPPSEQAALAQALPRGRLLRVDTLYGHDGFLVESARIDPLLVAFRDEAPVRRLVCTSASGRRRGGDGRVPIVLAGATGRVGRELLALLSAPGFDPAVRVVGAVNSRAALRAADGLPPGLAAERLAAAPAASRLGLVELAEETGARVIVDCTASPEVAAECLAALEQGIAVVSPNKWLPAAPDGEHARLRAALAAGVPAAFSATVGAGLPVLSTLRRLREAGDELLSVDATLSGTLGFVLAQTADGASLRSALAEAVASGLAEPDPRADLTGADVARKLLILLREAGVATDASRIRAQPLLAVSASGHWQDAIASHERAWLGLCADARRARQRWVYRARWSREHGARIGAEPVPLEHPLAGTRDAEVRVLLHTRDHGDIPLLIAGAGAGVRITAAAVLADLKATIAALPELRSWSRSTVIATG
jgi:homoserine O-acetyltransferase/O-succinyltransferase